MVLSRLISLYILYWCSLVSQVCIHLDEVAHLRIVTSSDNIAHLVHVTPQSSIYFAKVGRFKRLSRCSYVSSSNPGISFVALRWTFSIAVLCFFRCGAHTWFAYSTSGLTRALSRCMKVSSLI